MAKKLFFMLLVLGLIAGGAVVSMATGDGVINLNGALADTTPDGTLVPGINIGDMQYIEEDLQEEAYTYEKMIEEYDSLFFDKNIQTEDIYIKDIVIKKCDTRKDSIQYYELLVTLDDSVTLENGDSIVVMAFVEKDGGYELLGTPMNVFIKYPKPYKFELPFVGEDQPNCIRIIAFPKSSYDKFTLEDNLQIEHKVVTIPEPKQNFSIRGSLINTQEVFNIIKRLGNYSK